MACHLIISSHIDILTLRKVSILFNNPLLLCHSIIYLGFQFIPECRSLTSISRLDILFDYFDSLSKSKIILTSIKYVSTSDNPSLFNKITLTILASHINKYIYERFLLKYSAQKTFLKPISVGACILIFSSGFVKYEYLDDQRSIIVTSLVLFCGHRFDNQVLASHKLPTRRLQGRNKLRSDAKA